MLNYTHRNSWFDAISNPIDCSCGLFSLFKVADACLKTLCVVCLLDVFSPKIA